MTDDRHILCRPHCRTVRTWAALDTLSEVFAGRPSASILGANPAAADGDGFSYWAAEPREVFEFGPQQARPFEELERVLSRHSLVRDTTGDGEIPEGMFCGGWIGYFGYELGRHIERLPGKAVDDLRMPLIRLCFYDRVVAYDHRREVFRLIALGWSGDRESPEQKLDWLAQRLAESQGLIVSEPRQVDMESVRPSRFRSNMGRDDYLRAVQHIQRHIRDGDIYQANLSHRFEVPFTGSPVELFHWQNRYNPSGHAAYLDAGRFQVVSASPEMFVTIRNRSVQTKPIKGTRPRINSSDPQALRLNAERYDDLLTSEKEQAELNMIIDLERNDVARICKPGTRRVIQPRTIETCPTVYHAVATIGGELRDHVTFSDVLKAMFPGGSITGAPKIRAMEIIDDLEPTARGVYTGAIGFIGIDGTVCLNIAIRTVIIVDGRAFVQAGGGIVADSDPQAEWDETITKARALLAGIEAVQSASSGTRTENGGEHGCPQRSS